MLQRPLLPMLSNSGSHPSVLARSSLIRVEKAKDGQNLQNRSSAAKLWRENETIALGIWAGDSACLQERSRRFQGS